MADTVKVKAGDSMSALAAKAGVSLSAMKAANPQVSNPSLIKPGQVLNLPTTTPAKTTAAPIFNTDPATLALQKLTSGQTLTPAEKGLLGLSTASTSTGTATSTSTSKSTTSTSTSTTSTSTSTSSTSGNKTVVGTYTDPETGDIFQLWSDGTKTLLSAGTKAADAAAAAAKARYDAEQAALAKQAQDQADKRDAFALIQDTMRSYGFTDAELSELSGFIEKSIIDPNVGPNQAILNMRNLAVYQQRFAGNQERVKKGLNALSEADYLQQEKDYGQYFNEYGVANLATRSQMATMIGNDISATEAKNRIALAVTRVKNSDPTIMTELKRWYPSITDADLVSYFLKPDQALPELQKKVTASEIGAAAVGQGLSDVNALDLATYGVDRAAALAGYSDIKNVLPRSQKLADIYGEAGISYDQAAGEAEFLKQNQDAAEKRRRLKSLERATFSGATGTTTGSLGQAPQGMF